MEGIAGIVYPDVFQMNNLIQPMLATMQHRSKDASDIYTFKQIQIGVCGGKLASNENKTIFLCLDGTGTQDGLRKELEKRGVEKIGNTPQDIILRGYEVLHLDFLKYMSGNFALAILDQKVKKIILARDRIGVKPLYWFHDQHHLIFASELKAILATGIVPQTPAIDALATYLYFGYIPQDMTPIAKVNKLLPAYYFQYSWDGTKSIGNYWSFSSYFENILLSPKNEIIQHLDLLLRESVRSCLPKSSNCGCFLSGGIGSAGIAYYASSLSQPHDLPAFTVGFKGANDQDIRAAQEAGKILGLHQEIYNIEQHSFLNNFVKIAWHLDEPIADPNTIATWKLAEMASKKVGTVFSGMGSDELFAGHSRYSIVEREIPQLNELFNFSTNWIRKLLFPLFKAIHYPFFFRAVKKSRTNPWQFKYLNYNAIINEDQMAQASPKLAASFVPEILLNKFHHLSRVNSLVSSLMYIDVKTRLPDWYILQYERLTAAFGLEWQTPFLNTPLLEFAATLPEPEELQESETGYYLKAMFEDIFPPSFINRPKKTRRVFLQHWIESPQMRNLFNLLPKGSLVDAGLISQFWLQNKIDDLGKDPNAFRYLWTIFSLEIWFRLYIINPIQSSAPDIDVEKLLNEPL